MAGSYYHLVQEDGSFTMNTVENMRDSREALEECFDIIQRLVKVYTKLDPRAYLPGQLLAEVIEDMYVAEQAGHPIASTPQVLEASTAEPAVEKPQLGWGEELEIPITLKATKEQLDDHEKRLTDLERRMDAGERNT